MYSLVKKEKIPNEKKIGFGLFSFFDKIVQKKIYTPLRLR